MEGKTVAQSRIIMARAMQPTDANGYGNVHGGVIMRFVDEAAGAVAIRHAQSRCVTAFMTYTGHTSLEVECQVTAESIISGDERRVSTCYLVFVAIDEQGKPRAVPPLILESDEERARWQAAKVRRANRPH